MFGFRKRRHRVRTALCVEFCRGIQDSTLVDKSLGWFVYYYLTKRERIITPPLEYALEVLGGPKMSGSMSDWCRNYLEHESPEIRLEREPVNEQA